MVFFEKVIINITRKENVKTWADWKGCECSQSFFSPPPSQNQPTTHIHWFFARLFRKMKFVCVCTSARDGRKKISLPLSRVRRFMQRRGEEDQEAGFDRVLVSKNIPDDGSVKTLSVCYTKGGRGWH